MTQPSETPIKRYAMWCMASHGHDLIEHEKGSLVTYADYQRVESELSAAREEVERVTKVGQMVTDDLKAAESRAAEAREQAIKECANVCGNISTQHFAQREANHNEGVDFSEIYGEECAFNAADECIRAIRALGEGK